MATTTTPVVPVVTPLNPVVGEVYFFENRAWKWNGGLYCDVASARRTVPH